MGFKNLGGIFKAVLPLIVFMMFQEVRLFAAVVPAPSPATIQAFESKVASTVLDIPSLTSLIAESKAIYFGNAQASPTTQSTIFAGLQKIYNNRSTTDYTQLLQVNNVLAIALNNVNKLASGYYADGNILLNSTDVGTINKMYLPQLQKEMQALYNIVNFENKITMTVIDWSTGIATLTSFIAESKTLYTGAATASAATQAKFFSGITNVYTSRNKSDSTQLQTVSDLLTSAVNNLNSSNSNILLNSADVSTINTIYLPQIVKDQQAIQAAVNALATSTLAAAQANLAMAQSAVAAAQVSGTAATQAVNAAQSSKLSTDIAAAIAASNTAQANAMAALQAVNVAVASVTQAQAAGNSTTSTSVNNAYIAAKMALASANALSVAASANVAAASAIVAVEAPVPVIMPTPAPAPVPIVIPVPAPAPIPAPAPVVVVPTPKVNPPAKKPGRGKKVAKRPLPAGVKSN